jgi:hypothetical protein
MRATPGLVGGAGIAAGLMYLLGRQRGKRRRGALAAAALAAVNLGQAARHLRPRWRNGRITLSRPHSHPWAVTGAAASVLAAGMWRLRHRHPAQTEKAAHEGA